VKSKTPPGRGGVRGCPHGAILGQYVPPDMASRVAESQCRALYGEALVSKFPIDDAAGQATPAIPQSPTNMEPQEGSNGSGTVQGSAAPKPRNAPGSQSAPSSTKKRAKKIDANVPNKGGTGFSVGEDAWVQAILKPGHYPATVVDARINPRSGVVYLNIEYAIRGDDGRRFIVTDFLVLDAPPQNRQYTRSTEGKGRVKAIMEANGKPLQFASIQAVPLALIGCRVTIAVGHRDADGLPVPKVQGVVGPAEPKEEARQWRSEIRVSWGDRLPHRRNSRRYRPAVRPGSARGSARAPPPGR
jgi:hypothetical protein